MMSNGMIIIVTVLAETVDKIPVEAVVSATFWQFCAGCLVNQRAPVAGSHAPYPLRFPHAYAGYSHVSTMTRWGLLWVVAYGW